jgi:hypothetical protein
MAESVAETLYCANHPQTRTALRCNRCGKPICSKCAVRTPVGYRCKECVRGQQQIFETALWYDYAVAALIAAPLAGLAGFIVMRLGWFVIFLSPLMGGALAELVRAAVRRRRGRYLSLAAAGAFVLGCLPMLGLGFVGLLLGGGGGLFFLLWGGVYTFIGASTLYARLRGISL